MGCRKKRVDTSRFKLGQIGAREEYARRWGWLMHPRRRSPAGGPSRQASPIHGFWRIQLRHAPLLRGARRDLLSVQLVESIALLQDVRIRSRVPGGGYTPRGRKIFVHDLQ